MEQNDKREVTEALREFLDEYLIRMIISNPVEKQGMSKVKIRPLKQKDLLLFQAEELVGNQAFHKNLTKEECADYAADLLDGSFRQLELESAKGQVRILISKKGVPGIKLKRIPQKITALPVVTDHNRQKNYILKEGTPIPFLVDLGVMSENGTIIKSRYDKFRQINRFLEFVEDILPAFSREKEITILDFGCGKSYLTFAMYYYLRELKNYDVNIIGLDLKTDVIHKCNFLAEKYGYDKLHFYQGDIAEYEGVSSVDMVVTLHACDTATDFALAKAVEWGARVILSVPCCQHEVNKQIRNEMLEPVLRYGILKERMSALITDAVRANLLESKGYETQILEFIDMEHTPKNLLIRAVKTGRECPKEKTDLMMSELNIHPSLDRLLYPDRTEGGQV